MTAREKKQWLNSRLYFKVGEWGVLGGLLVADQGSKWWAQMHDMTVMNRGGVFGIYPSWWWGIGLIFVWLFLVRHWWTMTNLGVRWGMGMIVTGGLGNILDRLLFGSVRDFIYYPAFGFYGNIADIILGVGVGMVILVRAFQHEDDESETQTPETDS